MTLPEPMALEETSDALDALQSQGIRIQTLIVNRATPRGGCEWDAARRRFEARALSPLGGQISARAAHDGAGPSARTAGCRGAEVPGVCMCGGASCLASAAASHATLCRGRWWSAPSAIGAAVFDARLLLFGGKGGVGKTTCSAAVALDLARARPGRRFLLLSTDPAHSLGDVFGARVDDEARPVAGGPRNLDVREMDASCGLQRFRDRYRETVDAMFADLTRATNDASADRSAFGDLIDLAPPGVDEVMAIADVAGLLADEGPYRTIVADTAPTGHALRLLDTPGVLREWTQALMTILLKYPHVVRPGAFAQVLVDLSQRLRALERMLRDGSQTAFIIVTRPAALPREETIALEESLQKLGVAVGAIIVNAFGAGSCSRCRHLMTEQRRELRALRSRLGRRRRYAMIVTPATLPPPHGADALQAWRSRWRAVDPAP